MYMKTRIKNIRSTYISGLYGLVLMLVTTTLYAQVAVNTDNSPVDPSAMMEVKATGLGVLTPRMLQTERLAIASPATGLIVYQTDLTTGFYFFNGSSWDRLDQVIVETDPAYTAWNKSTGISITASQVSDFNTAVGNTPAELANTLKNSYPILDATKLAGIAAGAEVNVNADWNAVSGDAMILNKPSFAAGIPLPVNPANPSLLYYDGTNWVSKTLSLGGTGSNSPVTNIQPYNTLNYCISLEGIFPSRNDWNAFIGEIVLYPYNFEPLGTAFCHGQSMSISQNTALFALIGTYYGGNGQTTFNLPDLRGRTAIHVGQGPGLLPFNIAQSGGTETFTITTSQMATHTHAIIYQ
jgi:microcystin-dependent protein